MKKENLVLIGLLAVLVGLSGCMDTLYPQREYGASFESAKSNQILNPEAGKKPIPVSGMDGQAAQNAIEKYRQSFGGKQAPGASYGGPAGVAYFSPVSGGGYGEGMGGTQTNSGH